MKKILFLIFIGLAFVGCADPNNDAGNSNNGSATPGSIFSGTTSSGDRWQIVKSTSSMSGASTTVLLYNESSSSKGFSFSFGKSTIGDATTYTVIATATRTNGAYDQNHWNGLTIKTDFNQAGYVLSNPTPSSGSASGFYTFGLTSFFEADISDLTTNTTWISITLSDSSVDGNEDLTVTLPTEFITAMLTYF